MTKKEMQKKIESLEFYSEHLLGYINSYERDIKELKKENADLKEENKILSTQNKDLIHEIKHLTFHDSFFNSH